MGSVARMFDPKSVALIGATDREGSVGATILSNLLLGKDKRAVYPVNPKAKSIMAVKTYPSILDVPDDVDLACQERRVEFDFFRRWIAVLRRTAFDHVGDKHLVAAQTDHVDKLGEIIS